MFKRNIVWGLGAALLCVLTLMPRAFAAPNADRTTYLTFNRAVALPGVSLDAGTYIFERFDSVSGNVVRVASRDRKKSYFLGLTYLVDRPRGMREDAMVSLGEAPAGTPPPIVAWWPIGETTGHEFIYPKR
jgi:hypothetical protein